MYMCIYTNLFLHDTQFFSYMFLFICLHANSQSPCYKPDFFQAAPPLRVSTAPGRIVGNLATRQYLGVGNSPRARLASAAMVIGAMVEGEDWWHQLRVPLV